MALLTEGDILNKNFQSTKFRQGYDVFEVDDFLDRVLATIRELHAGNQAFSAENADLRARLESSERRVAMLSRPGTY